jgi:hypothetical protein
MPIQINLEPTEQIGELTKVTFMSTQQTKRKMSSGCFYTDNARKVWFKEFHDTFGNSYELIDPLELENFSRECEFKVLMVREFTDPTNYKGKTKAFFAIDYKCHLAENVSENIFIRYEKTSKKYFVSDLTMLGQTCEIGLESNQPELIVTHGEPYLVDQMTAKSIMETSGFCYGKCEVLPNGKLEFYKTV